MRRGLQKNTTALFQLIIDEVEIYSGYPYLPVDRLGLEG
jgi:hypothetical protein